MAAVSILLSADSIAKPLFLKEIPDEDTLEISLFSKHLQFLDYKAMSEAAKEMGFDGVDLTVRPKGHVLPERVGDDLPKAVEAMKSFGMMPQLLVTKIDDANDPIHKKVLQAASELGFQYYRTAWFKYHSDKDILESAQLATQRLQALAQLNANLKLSGSYQNHSGHYFGAGIWDLHQAIATLSPKHMGCQYDITHATMEGGRNWEIGFRLMQPHINTVAIKDFIWRKKDGKWGHQYVPLGEGIVNFSQFFALLKRYRVNVPMSVHVEYDLGGAEHGKKPSINPKEVFKRIKRDLDFVRRKWQEVD